MATEQGGAVAEAWTVKDGILIHQTGKKGGDIITEKQYENFELELEWKHIVPQGNAGLFVWSYPITAVGQPFTKSIEVQMQSGQAGDFWWIGENIEVPDMDKRRPHKEGQKFGGGPDDARNIKNLTDDSEKPLGEWNTMVIECKGDEVKVWVNGDLVNHGSKSTAKKGKIALQAEGTEVEFRKVELTPLAE